MHKHNTMLLESFEQIMPGINNAASLAQGGPAAILNWLRVKMPDPNEKQNKKKKKFHITNYDSDFNTFLQVFSYNIHNCSSLF